MVLGMGPENEFWPNSAYDKLVKLPIEAGRLPIIPDFESCIFDK